MKYPNNSHTNGTAHYKVTPLYRPDGTVAAHFADELEKMGASWDELMEDEHFAEIIRMDLQAEKVADEPLDALGQFAPAPCRSLFAEWLEFVNVDLDPWTTGGAIHFRPHWARVMVLALRLGATHGLSEPDLNALCMASVFHDSRRKDPYFDKGHGKRAADYYAQACMQKDSFRTAAGSDVRFDPRTYLAVKWHDREDSEGEAAIRAAFDSNQLPNLGIDDLAAILPEGTLADPVLFYHIFKDADALDRVRLGENDLDPSYLRTEEARNLIPFASDLLRASFA